MDSEESIPLVANINTAMQSINNSTNIRYGDMPVVRISGNAIFLFIICLVVALQTPFVVDPGNIGLIVTLGKVISVESGLHFKIPLVSRVITLTTKTQKLEESNSTPTKEGLSVQLDTAM
jgi:regulator of protease activity HflC (stomatin/prohibitin superfamily)